MSFTLPRIFRLENNNEKNNLKKIKSLLLFPPHFFLFIFFLPCAFAIGPIGCPPRQGCLWPLLQGDGENEVTASQ